MSEENKTEEELEEQEVSELDELEAKIIADDTEEAEEEESSEEESESQEQEEESQEQEQSEEKNSEEKDNRESAEEKDEGSEEEEKPEDNGAWARARRAEKKARDLERQLAEANNPKPAQESAKDAVEKLVKVWDSGDGNDKPMLKAVRQSNSSELVEIYNDAISGKYGEHGDDVIKMIQQELPVIQQREAMASKDANAKREASLKAYNDEIAMAKSDFKDFADAESEGGKFYANWLKDMAGTLDANGIHDGGGKLSEGLALYLHTHPYEAQQFAHNVFASPNSKSEAQKAVKLQKEVDVLKKKLLKYESPADPSASQDRSGGKKTVQELSLEELEKQIES